MKVVHAENSGRDERSEQGPSEGGDPLAGGRNQESFSTWPAPGSCQRDSCLREVAVRETADRAGFGPDNSSLCVFSGLEREGVLRIVSGNLGCG